MLGIFTYAFLRYQLKKKLNVLVNQSKKSIKSFRSMAVIIPYDINIEEDIFITLAKSFNISPKSITIVVFSKKRINERKPDFGKRFYCSKNDLNFFGGFTSKMQVLFDKKFDLLINYFSEKNVLPELISVNCSTKLRLGFFEANHGINDIILQIAPGNTDLFLTESKNYLNAFLKK